MPRQSHLHSYLGTLLLSLELLSLTNLVKEQSARGLGPAAHQERPRAFSLCVFVSEGSITERIPGPVCWVG